MKFLLFVTDPAPKTHFAAKGGLRSDNCQLSEQTPFRAGGVGSPRDSAADSSDMQDHV